MQRHKKCECNLTPLFLRINKDGNFEMVKHVMENNNSIWHYEMEIELTSLTIELIRIRHLGCFHLSGFLRETYMLKRIKNGLLVIHVNLAADVLLYFIFYFKGGDAHILWV